MWTPPPFSKTYCAVAPGHEIHGPYHDREYGFPRDDDRALLELLCLELNQAGLSWLLILKKREDFRRAFKGFDPETVAGFGARDRARLMADPGIVRNRLKIEAAIHNAGVVLGLCDSHGSFDRWLRAHHPLTRDQWVKLFRKTFRFTGGEITNEFLMCLGYLPGAHHPDCPVFARVAKRNPPWMAAERAGRRPKAPARKGA